MFASRGLSIAERCYNNTEKETLGIFYALKEFPSLLLSRETRIITDFKLIATILKKDVATLSQ